MSLRDICCRPGNEGIDIGKHRHFGNIVINGCEHIDLNKVGYEFIEGDQKESDRWRMDKSFSVICWGCKASLRFDIEEIFLDKLRKAGIIKLNKDEVYALLLAKVEADLGCG